MPKAGQTNSNQPQAITGIQAMQGHGVKQARGFWAEAWSQVIRRFSAIIGFSWLGLVAFFAVTAPFVANGHPLRMVRTEDGQRVVTYPLFQSLTAADWLLLIAAVAGGIFIAVPLSGLKRPKRLGWVIVAMVCGTIITLLITLLRSNIFDRIFGAIRDLERTADGTQVASYPIIAITIAASIGVLALLWIPFAQSIMTRLIWLAIAASVTAGVIGATWNNRAPIFNYTELELRSDVQTTYTIIPWSPNQRPSDRNTRTMSPGQTDAQALVRNFNNAVSNYLDAQRRPVTDPFGPEGFRIARSVLTTQPLEPDVQASLLEVINRLEAENPEAVRRDLRHAIEAELSTVGKRFPLGTDNQGQDMLSQLLHACRLSISIGLVSTGISLIIGITVGALMGYFGGWVDLILYRFVEIFMAIPVLFLLIVAAGVLPKNIYVMMIIIGCFSWTGAARFIRAEFLKLRNMDFVQSARATGLPLRSILFKHMLPNGVTPVLVESSFAIAAAILAEATLSYLGLGPDDQASWGKLLASATGQSGEFFWWLAIFPGLAIFLTVLSYNLIGEALRDAIDPKLKKARV